MLEIKSRHLTWGGPAYYIFRIWSMYFDKWFLISYSQAYKWWTEPNIESIFGLIYFRKHHEPINKNETRITSTHIHKFYNN